MNAYTRSLRQDATYWPPITNDGFGGKSVSIGVLIKVRWEDKTVLFRSVDQREETSSSVVYTKKIDNVVNGGKLALGDFSGDLPPSNEDVFEVRQVSQSPSIKDRYKVVKVFL